MSIKKLEEKLYIIIVTYNGIKWIEKCIASCKGYQIVVVDNNSTDATLEFIKKNFPSVIILPQTKNLGFGAANNVGMSFVLQHNCDYVFLLNQDAYLETNTIDRLIKIHKDNLQYGVLSPIHLNGNGDKLDSNFSNYLAHKFNDKFYFDAIFEKLKNIYEVPFVNAAAWLLPKQTIEKIGGFDPIFFHYGEDDNYCQRVLFHQFKIGIVPNSYILHDREFRENDSVITNTQKLKLKERSLKNKWANINYKVEDDINSTKQRLQRIIFRLRLKLKFRRANIYKNELSLIKKIIPQITESRNKNNVIGAHYLTLKDR